MKDSESYCNVDVVMCCIMTDTHMGTHTLRVCLHVRLPYSEYSDQLHIEPEC